MKGWFAMHSTKQQSFANVSSKQPQWNRILQHGIAAAQKSRGTGMYLKADLVKQTRRR